MPVSLAPLVILGTVVATLLVAAISRNAVTRALVRIELVLATVVILSTAFPAVYWGLNARSGDAAAQYQFSRWCVNNIYSRQIEPPVERSLYWLRLSAEQGYPPAMYALGVQYKQGFFVPKPLNWRGSAGNTFPQPEVGQIWIDRAIKAGYRPPVKEDFFYWKIYREE